MKATRANMRILAQRENEPIAAREVFMRCGYCGAEYSASEGDYFMLPDDKVLTCDGAGSHPEKEMVLARSERIIHDVADDV